MYNFDLKPFVDSDMPALKYDGYSVEPEEWDEILVELENYQTPPDEPELELLRLSLIDHIKSKKLTQEIYNKYCDNF
jgi:hypothetical protein